MVNKESQFARKAPGYRNVGHTRRVTAVINKRRDGTEDIDRVVKPTKMQTTHVRKRHSRGPTELRNVELKILVLNHSRHSRLQNVSAFVESQSLRVPRCRTDNRHLPSPSVRVGWEFPIGTVQTHCAKMATVMECVMCSIVLDCASHSEGCSPWNCCQLCHTHRAHRRRHNQEHEHTQMHRDGDAIFCFHPPCGQFV